MKVITVDVGRPPKIEDSGEVCSTPIVYGEVELYDTVCLRLCAYVSRRNEPSSR